MLTKIDLNAIEAIFNKNLGKKLNPIEKDIRLIRRDLKRTINFFDREFLGVKKRVDKIEEHLHLQ